MSLHVGVDVQVRRSCSWAVLNDAGRMIRAGWLSPEAPGGLTPAEAGRRLASLLDELGAEGPVSVGIDSPRTALTSPRRWRFRRGRWKRLPRGRKGWGRHCEVVLKSLGVANPQWTPLAPDAPEWMELGFELFRAASSSDATVFEVLPSATYGALGWERCGASPVRISLAAFADGPRDMLDAVAGAFTVLRMEAGKGVEVGGGDGLGTIVLPCPLPPELRDDPVHRWPGRDPGAG